MPVQLNIAANNIQQATAYEQISTGHNYALALNHKEQLYALYKCAFIQRAS